jgi:hypothetical protein
VVDHFSVSHDLTVCPVRCSVVLFAPFSVLPAMSASPAPASKLIPIPERTTWEKIIQFILVFQVRKYDVLYLYVAIMSNNGWIMIK